MRSSVVSLLIRVRAADLEMALGGDQCPGCSVFLEVDTQSPEQGETGWTPELLTVFWVFRVKTGKVVPTLFYKFSPHAYHAHP